MINDKYISKQTTDLTLVILQVRIGSPYVANPLEEHCHDVSDGHP